MTKKKGTILFIIGMPGFGEINLPLRFADQLSPQEYDFFFMAPKECTKFLDDKYPIFIITSDIKANMDFFASFLSSGKVILIVFSTYYDFAIEKYFSLDWVEACPIPIATFLMDYMNISGSNVVDEGNTNKKKHLKPIPEKMRIICGVPKTSPEPSDQLLYFNVYPYIHSLTREQINAVRQREGCPPEHKLILFPAAKWSYHQSLLWGHKHLYYFIGKLIRYLFDKLEQKVFIAHIADYPILPMDPSENVHVKNYKSIDTDRFNELLLSSDMIINLNPNSPVIGLACYGQIPCISFINSFYDLQPDILKTIEENADLHAWYHTYSENIRLFPFAVFPTGRVKEAADHWANTPVEQAHVNLEIQFINQNLPILREFLNKGNRYHNIALQQKKAVEFTNSLPLASQIMDKLLIKELNTC